MYLYATARILKCYGRTYVNNHMIEQKHVSGVLWFVRNGWTTVCS